MKKQEDELFKMEGSNKPLQRAIILEVEQNGFLPGFEPGMIHDTHPKRLPIMLKCTKVGSFKKLPVSVSYLGSNPSNFNFVRIEPYIDENNKLRNGMAYGSDPEAEMLVWYDYEAVEKDRERQREEKAQAEADDRGEDRGRDVQPRGRARGYENRGRCRAQSRGPQSGRGRSRPQ